MLTTVVKRLLQGCLVLLMVMVLIFVLLRLIPGSPARQMSSVASEEAILALEQEMGLDKSIPEQLVIYVKNLFQGNLGYSWFQKMDVVDVVTQSAGKTAAMLGLTLVVSVVLGLSLGLVAAVFHLGGPPDQYGGGHRPVPAQLLAGDSADSAYLCEDGPAARQRV